jgi:cytochrome c-type biogenesis protein CcmF
MIPELGHLCLVLALIVSVIQAAMPLIDRLCRPYRVIHAVKSAAMAVFLLVSAAFVALLYSYAVSDFSVLNVLLNSHSSKPLLYKITGSWGNHEGSMLLWVSVLAACGFLVAWLKAEDAALKATTLSILGALMAGFLAFILFTSNPFLRVFPIPPDGEDLNPILQDIGLAFHPPTLYVGYVGYGVAFAYAMAGLLLRRVNAGWARAVHPWILIPWVFLTLGIGAGSWWAYRELGWGGWWFWDPVENVSLLPWLVGTALLHSNKVLMRRGQLAGWVVLLAILAFTLSLIGTFIVRSGLITSVHAFASDPARGLYILGYIVLVSGAALLAYSLRAPDRGRGVALLSRSGFILVNNVLLVAAAAIILLAILYPLALTLLDQPSIAIGPSYYNSTVLPVLAALPILAALAPLMAWDMTSRAQLAGLVRSLVPALGVALVLALAFFSAGGALLAIALAFACWLVLGLWHYWRKLRVAKVRLWSAKGVGSLGMLVAHLGFALFLIGMGFTATLKTTYEMPMDAEKPMIMGDYEVRVLAAERREQYNFESRTATLEIRKDGVPLAVLKPELRYYPVRDMQTTEAALHSTPWHDLYMVLGESTYARSGEASVLGVRLYVMPAQQWIWYGFVLAALGGLLALVPALRRTKGE